MRSLLLLLALLVTAVAPSVANAQQTESKTGNVTDTDSQTVQTQFIDLATFDFKNFTYPVPGGGKTGKSFTLKNGVAPLSRFRLRKTYFFELTRDKRDEAVSMIMALDCADGCPERSLFFVHTPETVKPRLIFQIAFGADSVCGLKAINFAVNEVTLEAFGDCVVADWQLVKSAVVSKGLKPTAVTRITFSRGATGFIQESREVLSLETIDLSTYRPQISFGTLP